jgi:hypothetical protein
MTNFLEWPAHNKNVHKQKCGMRAQKPICIKLPGTENLKHSFNVNCSFLQRKFQNSVHSSASLEYNEIFLFYWKAYCQLLYGLIQTFLASSNQTCFSESESFPPNCRMKNAQGCHYAQQVARRDELSNHISAIIMSFLTSSQLCTSSYENYKFFMWQVR